MVERIGPRKGRGAGISLPDRAMEGRPGESGDRGSGHKLLRVQPAGRWSEQPSTGPNLALWAVRSSNSREYGIGAQILRDLRGGGTSDDDQ